MEGEKDMKASPGSANTERIAIAVIIIFHVAGLIGLCIPSVQPWFLAFVPWHLLVMLLVILLSHQSTDNKFTLYVIAVIVFGYLAEWAGVHRHWLFGDYQYGQTLGLKVSSVPLIIGVNWFLLTYSAGVLMQRSRLHSRLARIITGALLLVALDFVIEPVAIRLDYWHWANNSVPLLNYASWFIFAVAMLTVFELFRFKPQSRTAPVFLAVQFVFFVILYFMNRV